MESAIRMNKKNIVEITTTFNSFSLAPFRCMKKRATSRALVVAMIRATAALKGPRSTWRLR